MTRLTLSVTTHSPLHIGGETRQNTDATRPMLKTAAGLPYIPATSIKGRLRHEVERLLRGALGPGAVCDAPVAERMCQPLDDAAGVCPACHLFGSPWREAALYFHDLDRITVDGAEISLMRRDGIAPQTQTRAGVRINRRRRVVEDQFLFDTELFEPGIPWTFSGTANYLGRHPQNLVLIYMAARAVTMMGSARSRGLGWSTLVVEGEDGAPSAEELQAMWTAWREAHS